jgi:hypothetical protein
MCPLLSCCALLTYNQNILVYRHKRWRLLTDPVIIVILFIRSSATSEKQPRPSTRLCGTQSTGGRTNDVDMHVDDMEFCASGVSTASRNECKIEIEMSAKEVSGEWTPLKGEPLEALASQSRATNALSVGDGYLRTIESWWLLAVGCLYELSIFGSVLIPITCVSHSRGLRSFLDVSHTLSIHSTYLREKAQACITIK